MAENAARQGNYAGIMSTAAAVAAVALLLRSRPVSGDTTFPPELMQLLAAMGITIEDILAQLRTGGGAFRGWPENTDQVAIARFSLAIGAAVQLDDIEVPDGFTLVVKADPGNPAPPARVYIATSAAAATNPGSAWPLIQNEARGFNIKNAKILWASATAIPAWLNLSVEHRS